MKRRDFLKAAAAPAIGLGCARNPKNGGAMAAPQRRQRPNVLWLMTDEQRTDSLGCYGAPWAHSPNLDRLAAEGVRFDGAVTPSPVCISARTSIMTGRHPCETNVWFNKLPDYEPLPSLTRIFEAAGYKTATFGKQHYASSVPGFQHQFGRILSDHVSYFSYHERYDEAQYDVLKYPEDPYHWIFAGTFPASMEETAEMASARAAMQWLEGHAADGPFLLRLSLNAPHTPVTPPPPFDEVIDPDTLQLPPQAEARSDAEPCWVTDALRKAADASFWGPQEIAHMRRAYYGWAAFADHVFGRLLDWMRPRGLLDNTIVAFVSDHGTHLADFGGLVQKQTFFEPSVTVPYFFWYPREYAMGAALETPVEARTLLPTLLETAGLDLPAPVQGDSLAGALREGAEPASRPVYSELTLESFESLDHDMPLVMVREGPWKLSLAFEPAPACGTLVNLEEDPYERVNLYGRPDHAALQERLAALAQEHGLRWWRDNRPEAL